MAMRTFLLMAFVATGAGHAAAGPISRESSEREYAGALPRVDVTAGPMAGHATPRTATLWVQLSGAARVEFEFWPAERPTERRRTATPVTDSVSGFIATAEVDALREGEQYGYRVLIDGREATAGRSLTFRTPPRAAEPFTVQDLRFAFGSCAMIADPSVDPIGTSPGGEYGIFDRIADQRPDFMLWGGDNVYFRDADWTSLSGMRRRYRYVRAHPALQRLFGSTNHYAAWDDHDYGPNDADRSWVGKQHARRVFAEYWANPGYGVPGAESGVGTAFRWGDVEFFLMDDRTFRAPNGQRGGDGDYWGAGQLQWLIDALRASTATFKIVVNGGQVVSPLPQYENMARYARERDMLLDRLARDPVDGVLFLSGDRHVTELTRMPRPGLYPLYDATISPLTSAPIGQQRVEPNPWRVEGTWLPARNFAMVEVTGPRADRVLTMIVHDATGRERWRHVIPHRELRAP
jgi:alkaline phosphatase D